MTTAKTLTDYRAALDRANARLEAARAAVRAAEVPADDIDTGYHGEPVTTSGWYEQRTISGRPAWRHCQWVNGRLREDAPTYDLAVHKEISEAALAQYDAQQAYQDHHPAYGSPWAYR